MRRPEVDVPLYFFKEIQVKKHAVLLAMASALSLASFGASAAQVTLVWCNGCSQQQEGYAAAQELNKENTNPTAPTRGMIYVGNNGAIHKYSVFVGNRVDPPHCRGTTCTQPQRVVAEAEVSGGSSDGMPRWNADPMTVESSVQTAFNDMNTFYNTAPVGWTKSFTVKIVAPSQAMSADEGIALHQKAAAFSSSNTPVVVPVLNYPNPNVNAYDVVNRGAAQEQLLDYLRNVPAGEITSAINHVAEVAAVFKVVDYSAVPKVVVEVVFTDNSSVDAIMDSSTHLNRFSLIKDTGRDSNHNPIPTNKAIVQGEGISKYEFNAYGSNSGDALNMYNQISELGVSIAPTVNVGNTQKVGYISCFQSACHVVFYQK
jgi:hypothetical protein